MPLLSLAFVLDAAEQKLLPKATAADVALVKLLLLGSDAASAKPLQLPDLISAIKDCLEASGQMRSWARMEVHPNLVRVADRVAAGHGKVQATFSAGPRTGLSEKEVVAAVYAVHTQVRCMPRLSGRCKVLVALPTFVLFSRLSPLNPSLSASHSPQLDMRELRYLLFGLHHLDTTGSHATSYIELLQLLRLVHLTKAGTGRSIGGAAAAAGGPAHGRPSFSAQPGPGSARPDWVLEVIQSDGASYLFDAETSKVYSPDTEARWPKVAGSISGSGHYRPLPANSFFAALDEYLKVKQARLKEVFDHFDADKSGSIDPGELAQWVRELMPESSPADASLVQLMIMGSDSAQVHASIASRARGRALSFLIAPRVPRMLARGCPHSICCAHPASVAPLNLFMLHRFPYCAARPSP